MAKGTKKDKKDKKAESQEDFKPLTPEEKKRRESTVTKLFAKAASIFLMLYVWSFLYVKKYIPYKEQNAALIEALTDPEYIRHTVKAVVDYQEFYNGYMEEKELPNRLNVFKKITKENAPTEADINASLKENVNNVEVDEEEAPIQEVKTDIEPENEDDVEVIGDMMEEIQGGEIYTVDEIFEKLGIKKTSEYNPSGEYERNLLKEFRMDREMPENIAKKADYYKPVIERGLKEDERFFVKKINDKKGYGLFANVDIVANEVLGVYTGVIQATESEKGKKYEWYYSTIPDRQKEKMVELRVNAKNEGSALRFVNHSMFYNARIEYVPYNNQWYIVFVSNRYIRRGEEVTVNYREKTKRMPEKIIDKWDKVEQEEIQKLYEEYMKLKAEHEAQEAAEAQKQGQKVQAQEAPEAAEAQQEPQEQKQPEQAEAEASEEKKAPVKEEL